MNWEKLKTFLIVLFSLINVFLIASLILMTQRGNPISEETIRDTVDILSENGITLNEKHIPRPQKAMENIQLTAMAYTDTFPKSAMRDADGTFTLSYNTVAKSNRDVKKLLSNSELTLPGLTFDKEFSDGTTYAHQEVSGYEIFGAYLEARTTSDGTQLKGIWYSPLSEPVRSDSTGDVVPITSILIEFISNPNRPDGEQTIIDIQYGYHIPSYDSGVTHLTVTAVPSWRILLSGGEQFYYDARTGEEIT